MPTTNLTAADFEQTVADNDIVLVDFWAAWCAPCKAIAPHLDQLAVKHTGKLKVVKVDASAHMATARKYNVLNLPTFVLFKGGVEVGRKVGTAGGIAAIEQMVLPSL